MKMLTVFVIGLFIFLQTACSGSAPTNVQNPTSTLANSEVTQPTLQPTSQAGNEVSFSKDIFPIFQQYSDSHHARSSILSLETYEGLIQDVIPGQPEQSKLYQRLIGQGGPVMPPGNPLPEKLIKLIYDWIKQGAKNN